ncbi:hypothetical protein PC116_g28928 [Phytophthora cactorum]|nr:hypothetical protein GQ600_1780 [Phytophthora cactorum]KAG2871312.1 hypothetical protein PC114_g26983 [Phytophthora cactorum]KAG2959456.1 hypothetical protein PC119_g26699 [Phytophthora cactorum]KAG3123005.1 hypothetical protein C6341_g26742 [Phytophthora cactorum]KAG4222597.1 hypothetical protein PC116_g28928 [Phytophthora cactorum]
MPSSKQLLQDKVRLASAGATYDGLPYGAASEKSSAL